MKFQSSQNFPPHQDRRLQLRMLGIVGLIALVMFAWQAWRIGTGRGKPSHPLAVPSPEGRDFTVAADRTATLKDDELRIAPRRPRTGRQEVADEPDTATINPAWLAEVHDDSVGIRQHEAEAYYRILAKAASLPANELQSAAAPHVLYADIMSEPETYRGRPITITGDLAQLYEFRPPANEAGVSRLYEAWIFTADSGTQPYRVVASAIPPEIKPQDGARHAVQVTGYFFKREGYETTDHRLHVAPTLLAGKLATHVSSQSPPPVQHVVPWMIGVISVVGLAILATVLGFAVGDARGRTRTLSDTPELLDTSELLRVARRPSIEESLRRFEDGSIEDDSLDEGGDDNGRMDRLDSPEELIDLPTPFPPTRVPRRNSDAN